MEDYTEFVTFNILGDDVKVLCTETVYGDSVVTEIDNKLYYIGLVRENIECGRFSSDMSSIPNLTFASIGWQIHTGRLLTREDTIRIVGDNPYASIKTNSE